MRKWSAEDGFEDGKNRVKPDNIESARGIIEGVIDAIRHTLANLEARMKGLGERDGQLFEKLVKSVNSGNTERASMLATELAEFRRMHGKVASTKFALETMLLRLFTVRELGEIVSILSPAVSAMRSVASESVTVVPEFEDNLNDLAGTMGELLQEASHNGNTVVDFKAADGEAEKILETAGEHAYNQLKVKLPDLPAKVDAGEQGVLEVA